MSRDQVETVVVLVAAAVVVAILTIVLRHV